jgi:hypothetical protein
MTEILIPFESHQALIPSIPPSLCHPRSETCSTPSAVSKSQVPRSVQTSSAFLHSGIIYNSNNGFIKDARPRFARGGATPEISTSRELPDTQFRLAAFHRGTLARDSQTAAVVPLELDHGSNRRRFQSFTVLLGYSVFPASV